MRGDPPLQINWTRNGVELGNNNTYIVDHMTFNHTGLYGCMANNSAGKTQTFFWIDVTGKVSMVHALSNQVMHGINSLSHFYLSWKFNILLVTTVLYCAILISTLLLQTHARQLYS